jgi:hypothetical protein
MRRFRVEYADKPIDCGFDWYVYDRLAPHGLQIVAWCRGAEEAETVAAAFEDTFGDRR